MRPAHVAQLVEHVLGKDEVSSSILLVGSPEPGPRPELSMTTTATNIEMTTDNDLFGRT
jgi:hypothetical protein